MARFSLTPATRQLVDLADVDGAGLQELLEDDAVLAVLAGGDADVGAASRRMRAWPRMSSGLVGSSIHQGSSAASCAGAVDGFFDAPLLIGVDHELVGPADLFADDAGRGGGRRLGRRPP